ncbi:(Fe-S)-binding protein [Nitrosospira sp. Nl5]|uniref:(Fe-S)-binding protein n=1 Tax=Nitrosospira sp. Nl5 TaxID=200120 RepID=UPI000B87F4A2|nr:(Fe-S)-binding protein [Nitrosospira sp. Nl5]
MKPSDLPPDVSSDWLAAEANRCVACGLCLPHCPTYRITLSEADSPRGRIALMSGVAGGRIPMNARFALHMDRCLTCRACEAACPSHVNFGQLIDGTRARMLASAPPLLEGKIMRESWFRRVLERELIAKPARLDAFRPFLRFYQRSGMQELVRKSGLLGKTKLALLEAQLPRVDMPCSFSAETGTGVAKSWQAIYPSIGKPRGEVGLFLGCVARLTDAATLNAGIFVLNRLGYTVHVPPMQTCCGALHQHGGDSHMAAQLAHQNMNAFDGLNLSAVISMASGCGAQLAEYPSPPLSQSLRQSPGRSVPGQPEAGADLSGEWLKGAQARNFSTKVMDISAFLAAADGWDDVQLAPLPRKIAIHEPCSLRNALRGTAHPYTLLSRIPGSQVVPLAGNDQCCGAAGTYFLDQPEMAKALLHDKTAACDASGAHYLATSNIGCAMHIASALRTAASETEVLHPVTLLARQMGI